jgi:hypothetical protein
MLWRKMTSGSDSPRYQRDAVDPFPTIHGGEAQNIKLLERLNQAPHPAVGPQNQWRKSCATIH